MFCSLLKAVLYMYVSFRLTMPLRSMIWVTVAPLWLIYFTPLGLQRHICNRAIFYPLFFKEPHQQATHQNYHYILVSSHCRLEKGNIDSCHGLNVSNSSPVSALSETDTAKHCTSEHFQQLTSEGLDPSGSGSNRLDYVIATICLEK